MNDLMKDLISNENLRRIRFRVYDAGDFAEPAVSPSAANLLYDSVTGLVAHGGVARGDGRSALGADLQDLNMVVVRNFGGRRWVIAFAADAKAISGPQRYLPELVVISGVIISVLLSWLAYALSSSRARAVAVAEQMTYNLRESQAALAEAQQIARLGDWRIDLKKTARTFPAKWPGCSDGAATIRPRNVFEAIDAGYRAVLREKMQAALQDRQPFEFECPYRSRRGRAAGCT